MAKMKHSEKVPPTLKKQFQEISSLTDSFCKKHLNAEYAQFTRYLIAALARKKPSPLERGQKEIWACSAVYALGFVNFVFDKTQDPHTDATQLCKAFKVTQSTASSKAKWIRECLKMTRMDPNWTLASKMKNNLRAWLISVNGFILDARSLPYEMQVIAYEKGLIPYIPKEGEN